MPKVAGLLDYFPKISSLAPEKVCSWISSHPNTKIVENMLGNELLYPQAIPVSLEEMEFRLALIREGLKMSSGDFYKKNLRAIYIPEELLAMFPNLHKFAWAIADAFPILGITSVLLKSPTLGIKNLGTIIRPEVFAEKGEISIWAEGKKNEIKIGSVAVIPVDSNKVDLKFESPFARLLNNERMTAEVAGGQLGLIVDTTKR